MKNNAEIQKESNRLIALVKNLTDKVNNASSYLITDENGNTVITKEYAKAHKELANARTELLEFQKRYYTREKKKLKNTIRLLLYPFFYVGCLIFLNPLNKLFARVLKNHDFFYELPYHQFDVKNLSLDEDKRYKITIVPSATRRLNIKIQEMKSQDE